MTAHTALPTILDAAKDYAARGWHVFPVPPGTKKSCKSADHSDGRKWGATTDPAEIERDWRRWPDANVGIVCGPASGFFVIEADTAAGHGIDGVGNLRALIAEHGELPDTIEARSPSGSWHLYFRWPVGRTIRNSASQVAPGVDVRGDGGMVVGVPSVKPGVGCYEWINPPPFFDLGDCPEWLLDLCEKKPTERAQGDPRMDTGAGRGWAEAALAGELARVLSAPQGARNATLNRAAFALGQIVAGGGLTEALVVDRLTGAALSIGLDLAEAEATIRSGLAAGMAEPRGPKQAATSDGSPRPNLPEDDPDLSHDALALGLGRHGWDSDARHVAAWGRWLFWNGTRWERDDKLDHLTQTRAFLRDRADALTAWAERKAEAAEAEKPGSGERMVKWAEAEARTLRHKNTVAAVEALARSNPPSVAAPDSFDADKLLLGTPGGVVDLRTGVLRPAARGDLITKLTAAPPAPPGARPARWLAFLDEVFAGDAELIAFMQRAAGYALTGSTAEHKLLFLYGGGRNGKSVYLNTLAALWADYARRAAAATFIASQTERHPTDIAGLQGARLVIASELPRGRTWDEQAIKDLTGGDKLTARFMRGDFFDFIPEMTLMIAGNSMPSFRGVDEAIRSRVVLVPFNVTIPPERRDRTLPEKLMAEGPAILRWAIEGALEWQRRGLDVPASVAAASADYFDAEDTVGLFLADEAVIEAGRFTAAADLHLRFGQWCQGQGLNPWTQATLIKELRARGFADHKSNGRRGLKGLRLT